MSETAYERANRLADEAKARAKARGGIDWSRYQPLAQDEPLEPRDSVEAEVWPKIEAQARRYHGVHDETETIADIVQDVLRELREEAARLRRLALPLREVLAAREVTLAYVDTGSGHVMAVETPLLTARVG